MFLYNSLNSVYFLWSFVSPFRVVHHNPLKLSTMQENKKQSRSMRTSTPRALRRNTSIPIRTIDIFKQPKPVVYADMGYVMSTPSPIQDPCTYAANVPKLESSSKPANRISEPLAPTYEETEAKAEGKTPVSLRSCAGDPILNLSAFHDLEGYKASMTVAGFPAEQYQARSSSRSLTSASGDITIMGDTSFNTTSMVTPPRRVHEGPQGSTAKRLRTTLTNDADVSYDTIKSVLRLVDESLINTPERKPVVTPKVLRAVPGPSPRVRGPSYAYSSSVQQKNFANLFPNATSVLNPFSLKRL